MAIIEKICSNHSEVLLDKVEEIEIPMNFSAIEIINNKKDLNVLSLFSGCGGMDLGFDHDVNTLADLPPFPRHPIPAQKAA